MTQLQIADFVENIHRDAPDPAEVTNIERNTKREGFKKNKKKNYGKFHIGSLPPLPHPPLWKIFFFSETRPFFENFL